MNTTVANKIGMLLNDLVVEFIIIDSQSTQSNEDERTDFSETLESSKYNVLA